MEEINKIVTPKRSPDKYLYIAIFVVVAFLGYILFAVTLLKNFSTNRNLNEATNKLNFTEKALSDQKEKTNVLEKDLIFYKNTDLAKEVEVLQLKLENTEKEKDDNKTQLSKTQTELSNLKANIQKINSYLSAIDAIEKMLSEAPNAANVSNIDSKISALKDNEVSNQWAKAKESIDLERASWGGSEVSATVTLITSRILSLTQ